jgi:transcriptional regulator with XRE-family HTH domain
VGTVKYSTVVGLALAHARTRAGLSQLELSERMDVPQSSLSRLESGAILMTVDQLRRAARCLDVSADRIVRAAEKLVEQLSARGIVVSDGNARGAVDGPVLRGRGLDLAMKVLAAVQR